MAPSFQTQETLLKCTKPKHATHTGWTSWPHPDHRPTSSLCLAASCLSQVPWSSTLQQQNNLLINCVHNFFTWSHISFRPPWKCYLPEYLLKPLLQPWTVGLTMTFLCLILCICNFLETHSSMSRLFTSSKTVVLPEPPSMLNFLLPKTIAIHFPHVYDLDNIPTPTSQDSCNLSTFEVPQLERNNPKMQKSIQDSH